MKKPILQICIFFICLIINKVTVAQVLFSESFGQSTTRQTSAFMPAASFIWADPNGNSNQKMIENNHYAVIAPANIRDGWPVPGWWFWTGAEPAGNTWGGANNPATPGNADHTGDANGAVMVVNAGTTINGIYERNAVLIPGNCYRLSLWFYLVNSSSSISLQIRDVNTQAVLGSYNTPSIFNEDVWQQVSYDFRLPASCSSGGAVQVYITNTTSAFSGNDYYVDDIVLETIACAGAPDISCPSLVLPVKLAYFNAAVINSNNVKLHWQTAEESDLKQFVVEKSTDGIKFYNAYVLPATNNITGSIYSITDFNTNLINADKFYYRLKVINNNATYSFSNTVRINLQSSLVKGVIVYPQPSQNGTVQVSIAAPGSADIELFDESGKKIKGWNNYNYNTLTIEGLQNGIYIIKVKQKESISTSKVLVTKNL